ncbi:amino acid decarboxylase [Skermania piniformis]|uniref:Y4yA family PLP-dependent enzyme n=1 Tax=Skermania pinensis TaxID=39122 RepID=A0ABX8S9C1_9ACTN|nr:amino acid decarboxylase [Skermania piniformis]QXQ13767.1 Y4yA family PLP-dependent enzyme [Skermania piniformis]
MELNPADPRPGPVPLPAREPSWVGRVRDHPELLGDIADAVGGPYHVLDDAHFAANLTGFAERFADAGVAGTIYFGKKANKAACWLPRCAAAGAGVDVASVAELVGALAGGVTGDQLVITGPAKSDELLWLAVRHRSVIAVDALDELARLLVLARTVAPVRLLLRIRPAADPDSRFGLTDAELATALDRCVEQRDTVELTGFSFHLTGYAVAPRAWQAAAAIDRCVAARARGLAAGAVSIGGGFTVDYVDDQAWQAFQREFRDSWFHAGKSFRTFYPYHSDPAGPAMLAAVLAESVPGGGDLAARLATTGTRLLIEPGRALLAGCGFSVFPVQGYKERAGYGIVTVAGTSLSLSEQWFGSEYLPDPVLWPARPSDRPVRVCVGGASCLEDDMLTWRKVQLPGPPRLGDLLIYPNTAGYQMDSNESEFHELALPPKVVVDTGGPRVRWRLDAGVPRSRRG